MNEDCKTICTELERRGYKPFKPPDLPHFAYIEKAYQKRFDDNIGKKYFIEAYLYEDFELQNGKTIRGGVEFDTQIMDKENGCPINIRFFSGWSVDEVEERMESLFKSGRVRYYEKWL